jgi:hypothetical protein
LKQLDLINEFRALSAQLKTEVESASAMGMYDSHKVSENLMCKLLSELCGYGNLRNLNRDKDNYPGIDLADDQARIAFQITATSDLAKVKHTLETFLSHSQQQKYERLVVYVLTQKKNSYSQDSINNSLGDKFKFDANQDVWDYRDLAKLASEAEPAALDRAIKHFNAYLRGVPVGLADEDVDPPAKQPEKLSTNLIELYFPQSIYVAQLNQDIKSKIKGKRSDVRKAIFNFCSELGVKIPSSFIVHGDTLITFVDLTDTKNTPYKLIIESGTEEQIPSEDFWGQSEDQEYAFRGLLRFTLQQRLYQDRVTYKKEENLFIFLPLSDLLNERTESWHGEKDAKRAVFKRQFNNKNPDKVLMQKHLAFTVDFHRFDENWYMAITPDWFFSAGESYRRSAFAYQNLKWIKQRENNSQVFNHFRFIHAWLKKIDEADLFSEVSNPSKKAFLTYGDIWDLANAPQLDESHWEALPVYKEDTDLPLNQRLFGK